MLEQLCKRDSEWRKMALFFCKNKEDADDLVQDMYLKFANYNKPLNDNYIFFALKSLFIDNKRKQGKCIEISIDDLSNFKQLNNEYCLETDTFNEITLHKIDKLPYFERELLKITTQEISQRELSRQTNINLRVIQSTVKKTKIQLWEELKRLQD
jgi:DNA-directed RNA polymerase specialized sigma24 family protein